MDKKLSPLTPRAHTEHVSRALLGGPVDSFCDSPDLSADGRYVAFASSARNLSPDVPGPVSTGNVFRLDRWTGEVLLASRAPDGGVVVVGSGAAARRGRS